MSKYNLIALAIAASLAAPVASAANITVTAAVENSNKFIDETVAATIPATTIAATADDNYLGRTVGYNVRVKLSQGTIKVSPTIAVAGGAASAGLVAGTGAVGDDEFVVRVVPNAAGTTVGEGFTITGLQIEDVAALGAGGSISLSGSVFDPTTAVELPGSAFNKVVYTAREGVAVNVTATATPNVIDVGNPSSKRYFAVSGGSVGSGLNTNMFNAGKVEITDATGVAAWLPAAGTVDLTVTGEDFAAFRTAAAGAVGATAAKIYLGDSTCATPIAGTSNAVISADGKTATFAGVSLTNLAVDPTTPVVPYSAYVCFDANSVTQIARQDLTISAVVKPGAAYKSYTKPAQALASLGYNGPVVNVYHFNPANNVEQVSYLRVSNTSGISGLVTVEGVCDNGTAAAGTATVTLGAQQSVLLTSSDIENGNATKGVAGGLGSCGGGKSRLTVTGEFGSMKVQNFLRNVTSAGMINTNVNNEN